MSLSVVIPCYKTPRSILSLVREIEATLNNRPLLEIILVCDGDYENAWSLIKEAYRESRHVRAVLLGKNVGQSRATLFGVKMARSSIIITMDDDGQHDPKLIPGLLNLMENSTDVVYVKTYGHKGKLRSLISSMVRFGLEKSNISAKASNISAFRVFRSQLVKQFGDVSTKWSDLDSLLMEATALVQCVTFPAKPRIERKSSYSLLSLLLHGHRVLRSNLARSISIIQTVAGFGALFSFLAAIFFIGAKLRGNVEVPGFTTLISLISLISSLMFVLVASLGKRLVWMCKFAPYGDDIWIRETLPKKSRRVEFS